MLYTKLQVVSTPERINILSSKELDYMDLSIAAKACLGGRCMKYLSQDLA